MNAFLYVSAGLATVLAVYLATGAALPRTSRRLLSAGMLTLALLNLLTVLAFGDPQNPVLLARPALAVALPALLYLHLATAMRGRQALQPADGIHIVCPLAVTAVRLMPVPGPWIDLAIVLPNLFYLGLIAWGARSGDDGFTSLRPALGSLLKSWRRLVILFLTVVLSFDILLMFGIGSDDGNSPQPWIFGVAGLLLTLGLTCLLVASLHRTGPLMWASSHQRHQNPEREILIAHLEKQLVASKAFLDPNMTLQRFARRVGVPAREVSAAINDCRNHNYNQWLNTFRIKEAQRRLRENPEESITEVMYASGFQNKSTFNTAFSAFCGESPSAWRRRFDDRV